MSTRKDTPDGKERDTDKENLILGQHQLVNTLNSLRSADVKIALLHHPPTPLWFREFDCEIHNAMLPEFDFVLRGHEHRLTALGIRSHGSKWIHIASGALYDHQEYPNGFNVVRLDLERGKGAIFLWRYYKEVLNWRKDVVLFPDGFDEFELPKVRGSRIGSATR